MGWGGACFMVMRLDLKFLTFFVTAHAPGYYISQCALRLSTPYGPIDFDVDVNDVTPDYLLISRPNST